MVVKNFRIFIRKSGDYTITNGTTKNSYGDYDNGLRQHIIPNISENNINGTWNDGYRVIPGCGNTKPTENDYYVETPSDLTFRGSVANPLAENQIKNITTTWENATASPITVKEVVLCTKFTPQYSQMTTAIIARKVLETSVTIASGEQYSFTYIITLNL